MEPEQPSSSTSVESKDQFSEGIMCLLKPVIVELDKSVKTTRQSQIQLRQNIDSLAEDLRVVSDQYQAPYDLAIYVRKLQESKKRVAVVGSILQNAQERLIKLESNIEKETARRKALLEPPTPNPPS